MKELSLFSGAGGGLLATHHLLGWETVGYVEFDDYCQRVLRARIDEGYLTEAPIFGDIRAFLSDGYAASYSGLVDVVSGGFPCQPFSCAGAGRAEADERNMWPETLRCIQIIRPKYVFLENVSGLLGNKSIACLCGRIDRRRGVHWDTEQSWEKLLCGDHDWHVGKSFSFAKSNGERVWRDGDTTKEANGKVVSGSEMAYWRGISDSIPNEDFAVSGVEVRASKNCVAVGAAQIFVADIAQWSKIMDEERPTTSEEFEKAYARFEQERPGRCGKCGRLVSARAGFVRYVATIFGQLAESGYDCRWRVLSGGDLGAPYLRERLWILGERSAVAESDDRRAGWRQQQSQSVEEARGIASHPERDELREQSGRRRGESGAGALLHRANGEAGDVAELDGIGSQIQASKRKLARQRSSQPTWWQAEPDVVRLVSRLPHRVDRITALGNAQVPAVAACAWEMLSGGGG